MITYNNIVSEIRTFFERHLQVNQFVHLTEWDEEAKENLYTTALLVPQTSNVNGNSLELNFNLFIVDLLNSDRSNQKDIFADTLSIVQDFIAYFSNSDFDWEIMDNSSLTPITEKPFDDVLSGWMLNFTVSIPFSKSICELPLKKKIYNNFYQVDKNNNYLYFADYKLDSDDYVKAYSYLNTNLTPTPPRGCSSLKYGNNYGRNFDWEYDEDVDVVIKTSKKKCNGVKYDTLGVAHLFNFTKEYIDKRPGSELFDILPFCIVDGINSNGLYINTNVVSRYDNPGPTYVKPGAFTQQTPMSAVCREILDFCGDVNEALDRLDKMTIAINNSLIESGQELHWLIGDKSGACVVVEIVNNQLVVVNKTFMTNFYLNGTTPLANDKYYTPADVPTHIPSVENGLGLFSQGVERYNIISDKLQSGTLNNDPLTLLDFFSNDLKYTRTYTNFESGDPVWYSEFTGIGNLTIDSPTTDFEPTLISALNKFKNRLRTDQIKTWQTVHSCVYDTDNNNLFIKTQENDKIYKFCL